MLKSNLFNYTTKAKFLEEKDLIKDDAIVFILETNEIWTHNHGYLAIPSGGKEGEILRVTGEGLEWKDLQTEIDNSSAFIKTADGGVILAGSLGTAGDKAFSSGYKSIASGQYSVAMGKLTLATGLFSHAEGDNTKALGNLSHASGSGTTASGDCSHAEGDHTKAIGMCSHAEGYKSEANGNYSHAEGKECIANTVCSHAEGANSQANNMCSHAEGDGSIANGYGSHAEGAKTSSNGNYSHSEGGYTKSSGLYSHAEGYYTDAFGLYAHAEGYKTSTQRQSEHASGQFNKSIADPGNFGNNSTLFTVGNGTAVTIEDDTNEYLHNAFEIRQNGDVYIPDTSAEGLYYEKPMIHLQNTLNSYFDNVDYDEETKTLRFYNKDEILTTVDATPFIVDNFVDEVKVEGGNLVITFNTEGKSPIKVPITDIFNADNYYNKTLADNNFVKKSGDTMKGVLNMDKSAIRFALDNETFDFTDYRSQDVIVKGQDGASTNACNIEIGSFYGVGFFSSFNPEKGNTAIIDTRTGNVTSTGKFISTVATGTAPLSVTSTTKVDNLNADMVDGLHGENLVTGHRMEIKANGGIIRIAMPYNSSSIVNLSGNGSAWKAILFINGYGLGTTDRIDARWLLRGSGALNVYVNGETENTACVYVENKSGAGCKISVFDFLEGTNVTEVQSIPSDAVYVDKTLALTTDTVAAATKLATPRTIWGNRFDGSGDIDSELIINANQSVSLNLRSNTSQVLLWQTGLIYQFLYYREKDNKDSRYCALGFNNDLVELGDYALTINANTKEVHSKGSHYVAGELNVDGNISVKGKIITEGGIQQASTFSTLTPVKTTYRAKPTIIVEAGKQYFNEEEGMVISQYELFSSSNLEASILSKYPILFNGENILVETIDKEGSYYMYTLKYMQISEDRYFICVSVKTFEGEGEGMLTP